MPGLDLPHMVSEDMARRLTGQLQAIVRRTVSDHLPFAPPGAAARAADAVEEFFALYGARPVKDNKGGSGFNDSLWIFVIARALEPRLVIESGVHKGHSTWLLRQACPAAEIHGFDITLANLVHSDPKAVLHPCDWTETTLPPVDGTSSLAFFDDHISHVQRLREAYTRGFRLLLFDDNFPVHQLYATGGPPVPTLAMVMDPELASDTEVRWTRNGKDYSFIYRDDEVRDARKLIAGYHVLPDFAPLTRYNAGSGLTFVRLVD